MTTASRCKNDGSVWAWGWNAYGQVGDGTLTNRTTPVQMTSTRRRGIGTDAAAGAHHSYALRTDGTVASWGRNYRIELGDGTSTNRTRPVNVLGVSTTRSTIGSGRDMGNVTLADGRVMAWGHNLYGQLGDGTTTNRSRAVFVPGITNAVKAGGGGSAYGVVLVSDGTPPANQPPVARITGTTCTRPHLPAERQHLERRQRHRQLRVGLRRHHDRHRGQPRPHLHRGRHLHRHADRHRRPGARGHRDRHGEPTDPGPPVDEPPVAHITGTTCTGLSCPLSGSTSTDDNGILDYEWDFGDTTTGHRREPRPHLHRGRHLHRDPEGDGRRRARRTPTPRRSRRATPRDRPRLPGLGGDHVQRHFASVVVPSAVQAGDQLVLVVTGNTAATHTTPAGWTLRGSAADGTELRSSVYTRTALRVSAARPCA